MLILGLDGGGTFTKTVLADVQTEAVTVVGMGIAVGGLAPGLGLGWVRLTSRMDRAIS